MYIFLSHSTQDKRFVRQLADSLAFYGIPLFFDERDIKVGDNIPTKIYDGLERATHVIYVLSRNSIQSAWVKEEFSVAKMRQLNQAGCHILPVLIDDISPPSSVAHIKYANFKQWEVKEYYLDSLQELLTSLGLKAQYSSSIELHVFQKHLHHLLTMMGLASSASQTYFQMERITHSLFYSDPGAARTWFHETTRKTWNIDRFLQAYQTFESENLTLGSNTEKLQQVLDLCKTIKDDYFYLSNES